MWYDKHINTCKDAYNTEHQRYANITENGPSSESVTKKKTPTFKVLIEFYEENVNVILFSKLPTKKFNDLILLLIISD